ncbi:MAG: MFS transporter [Chloracidobacterium sp.]|nr:MFS transporter [Chloracidobacterium sp.]
MLQPQRVRLLKVLLHIIFLLSGVTAVLVGPILPVLAKHFALNDLEVSFFFPAQFAGSLTGSFITSRLAKHNKYMTAAIIGGVMMAIGMLLMNADSFAGCLVGFFVNGLGIGLTLPSINMMIVEVEPERPAAALSFLNFCWGVGAILCKPFVDLFSTPDSIGLTTIILAVPLLVFSLLLRLAAGPSKQAAAQTVKDTDADYEPIWRMPIAWAIAFFNFVHVGFESGMGGWLTTYTDRLEGQPITTWLSPTLLYFLFFVIGRGAAPLLFRFLNENKMLFLGLAIVLVGMALTLSAHTILALSLGSSIAGFGTSWIFPTNVSRFSKTFGPAANRRATPLFMFGTLGAASVTWLIGFISNQTGNLRSGMYVLVVSVVVLIVVQIGLSVKTLRIEKKY